MGDDSRGLPVTPPPENRGEARQPLGLAVVGGLVFSQLITRYLTPVFYTYLEALVAERTPLEEGAGCASRAPGAGGVGYARYRPKTMSNLTSMQER